MARTADAVVIGGGIVGASIAYHLAKADLRVVLVEKGRLGAGGTGASTGIIRMHFESAPETRLAITSHPYWLRWAEVVGRGDPGFMKTGVLFLVGEGDAERLRHNVTMHRALGAKARALGPDEIVKIEPALDVTGVAVAAWEPDSGCVDSLSATHAFAEAAGLNGAEIDLDTTVLDITLTAGRIVGVRTDKGFIDTSIVVNAAGAWAAHVARLAHLALPLAVQRRQAAVFSRPLALRADHVCFHDLVTGLYARPDGKGAVQMGIDQRGEAVNPDDYNRALDPDFPTLAQRRLANRLPAMREAEFLAGWGGLYTATPDGKPILGRAGPQGFYLACGFADNGFKFAPAVGMCLAELIQFGAAKTVDITPFRLSRFEEGRPIHGEWEYTGGEPAQEAREL